MDAKMSEAEQVLRRGVDASRNEPEQGFILASGRICEWRALLSELDRLRVRSRGSRGEIQAMKPTPGPYKIHRGCNNTGISDANDVPIATFYGEYGSTSEQARANAEAWIAGVSAVEKLERIRALYVDKRDDELFSVAIEAKHILDET